MRSMMSLGLAAAVVVFVGVAQAGDLKSGLQEGETIGAYIVEKCAGNPNDGVADGEKLCYRCKMGNRPVVAVFAHKSDAKLTALVKELDQLVAKNADQQLVSFVNLLGENPGQLKKDAKKLVKKSKAANVAVVVPTDHTNGPANLKLNPDADVTVLIYKRGEIKANHALASGELNKKSIASIVADADKILR